MQVTSTTSTSPTTATDTSASSPQVSADQFLQLLITQLQNQDPLNPMDETQFMGELAQIQSVSELRQIDDGLTGFSSQQGVASATALLGRTVQWQDPTTGILQSGKIDAVTSTADGVTFKVGDAQFTFSDIRQISNDS